MLTGKEIVEKKIFTNYLDENVQQQGIDVRVVKICAVKPSCCTGGYIPKDGKTYIPKTEEQTLQANGSWMLTPGYYEVTFEEGCDIPNDCAMWFKTRSSGIRCGIEIRSGQFDAGFKTDHMGAFMKVEVPVTIADGARLAQAVVFTSNEVKNLYDGQFQGDKQR